MKVPQRGTQTDRDFGRQVMEVMKSPMEQYRYLDHNFKGVLASDAWKTLQTIRRTVWGRKMLTLDIVEGPPAYVEYLRNFAADTADRSMQYDRIRFSVLGALIVDSGDDSVNLVRAIYSDPQCNLWWTTVDIR